MVVYHARCLHKRIADGATYKFEAVLFKNLAHLIRKFCCGRNLFEFLKTILSNFTIDELPQVIVKRATGLENV